MRKHIKIALVALAVALSAVISVLYFVGKGERVNVPILMFHDIKEENGGTWSMSKDNFRATLEFLLEEGYTPISFEQLVSYVDGKGELPEKPVCITLDDGYYSNYRYVLPIVSELKVPVTVFMTCATVRDEAVVPDDENKLYKMSISELTAMESSPWVHIQSHSFGLHGENTTYGEENRDNVLPLPSEERSEYKEIFERDCAQAEAVLDKAGVEDNIVFSYPSGKAHRWSEQVLRERGYRVSLTTDYGHKNIVRKGKPESLFSLGRMNVNDDTTKEKLLKYLERDR